MTLLNDRELGDSSLDLGHSSELKFELFLLAGSFGQSSSEMRWNIKTYSSNLSRFSASNLVKI